MKDRRMLIIKDSTESSFTHIFFCPGCECYHGIVKGKWSFNENYEKPTIKPSILVRWTKTDPVTHLKIKDMRCHSFVTNGKIQFLGDCTHDLKNQTVDLPEIHD